MKQLKRMLVLAGFVAALNLGTNHLMAQPAGGRGNFDPTQFRQRMLDRSKETLEVTDDAEWKVLETAIGKVFDAQMEVQSGRIRGGRGGGNSSASTTNTTTNTDQGGRRRGGFGTPSAEAEALQKAIEAKAPADEIKAKLTALRESNKAKEDKLQAAQDDLRKLLTARQEATAVLSGLLK